MNQNQPSDEYPEHEKLQKVRASSQAIGEFIDHGGYVLAEYVEIEGYQQEQLLPARKSIDQILAEYFEIDLDKLDREKRAMLDKIREGA